MTRQDSTACGCWRAGAGPAPGHPATPQSTPRSPNVPKVARSGAHLLNHPRAAPPPDCCTCTRPALHTPTHLLIPMACIVTHVRGVIRFQPAAQQGPSPRPRPSDAPPPHALQPTSHNYRRGCHSCRLLESIAPPPPPPLTSALTQAPPVTAVGRPRCARHSTTAPPGHSHAPR